MRLALRSAAAVAAACLCACVGGTETGNPAVPVSIALGIRSSDPSVVALRGGSSSSVIDEAWVAFDDPLFLGKGKCGMVDDIAMRGPTLIAADLAAPDGRIDLEVEPGTSCGMWVPINGRTAKADLPKGAPPELAMASIVLRGARADGTPFILEHDEQDELEVVATKGTFDVSELGPTLFLAFDVANLMMDVDLDSVDPDADGLIRINGTDTNMDLHEAFDKQLECSLELYQDEDGNGELDEGGDALVGRCAEEEEQDE